MDGCWEIDVGEMEYFCGLGGLGSCCWRHDLIRRGKAESKKGKGMVIVENGV